MNEENISKRGELFRKAVIFQLKLMADGFRDLLLLPVSLIASLIGLVRGGDEPDREFNEVLELGRRTERWIDLFGNHAGPETTNAAASMDTLVEKMEETLKQQYKSSSISDRARAEIDQALQLLQHKAARHGKGKSADQGDQDTPAGN